MGVPNVPPLVVTTMVDVPALNVKLVVTVRPNAALDVNVIVLLPRLIVRVLLLLDDRDDAVTLKLLVVKVPDVMVSVPVVDRASANDNSALEAEIET